MAKNLVLMVMIFAVLLLTVIVYLLRKRKIPVKYALVWLFAVLVIVLITVTPNLMYSLANLLGFELLSNMILSMFIGILLFLTLVLTVMVANQKKKTTLLIQELSILKKEVEDKK